MEWRDEGAILAVRRHGESSAIIEVFTAGHGRHAGVVRRGASRRLAPFLQPGAQLDVTWRARLEDHLGVFTVVEPLRSRAGGPLGDRLALAGLNAVCALLKFTLPEREPHPALYHRSIALLDGLEAGDDWPLAYLRWELALLRELGFGLDLSKCAATGSREDLIHVSPRTGRAVSRAGAGKWADRLLPLPACLLGQDAADVADVADVADILAGLATTGHFLNARLAPALGNTPLPAARQRLIERLAGRYSLTPGL